MACLNLIDSHTPKSLHARHGFYILMRVTHHVLFDEDYDKGWGKATDALINLSFEFDVIDRKRRKAA